MITRDNIQEVVNSLSDRDKKRIRNSNKEFVVLELHCTNSGCASFAKVTNNYTRYKNVSNNGDCILSIDDPIFSNI